MKAFYKFLLIFIIGVCGTKAEGNYYIGLGAGLNFADMQNDVYASAQDRVEMGRPIEYHYFGGRRLKHNGAFAGKLFFGYEMDTLPIFFESGYLYDGLTAKHSKILILDDTFDSATPPDEPEISIVKLNRKHTFSVGIGARKQFNSALSAKIGMDLLYSRFEMESAPSADYSPTVSDVNKKKYKLGLAPWVGASLDFNGMEAGIRYQYARYQELKMSGDYSPSKFNIMTKTKPEYHTVFITLSKRI